MAKDKYGNTQVAKHRGAIYMPSEMGLTQHSGDIRRGIESRRSRVPINSGSVEDECWQHQRHNLFVGSTNYKLLSPANYGWVWNGGVIHHPGDYEYKINADCVPIATLLADSANEMSCSFWSACFARYGSSLNNLVDVSYELGPGKIRENSEDKQRIVVYPSNPTRTWGSTKSDSVERECWCHRQHNLIATASYEPCYLSNGQIPNGGVRYCRNCLATRRDVDGVAAHEAQQSDNNLAAASRCSNLMTEFPLGNKDEIYSLSERKDKGEYTLLLISHPEGCDGGEGIYVPFDELPQGTQNLPKILSTGSMILGKVLNSEYCSEYQARACPVYTAELVRVRDRAARVQQRENFETLEIGVGGKAADKQTQILCRSLGSHQRSVGLYLNYILVAQKFSSNCSLSRFTDYGASKLRNHSLQAPEYGAVGQYSKTSSKERNETRSRHPDESSGHPVIAYSLFCSTSPSPPPLAVQSLPANHSSSLGVPISHHQRADGYASPPGSSGSMKALYPPSPLPTPPAKLDVLRSSSDHPTSTNNIHSNTSSPLRNPSSCSLPSNSLCNNTSTQDKTREDITRSSPNLLAVVIAPNLSRFLRHSVLGYECWILLQFATISTTFIRFLLQHFSLPSPRPRPNTRRAQPAIHEKPNPSEATITATSQSPITLFATALRCTPSQVRPNCCGVFLCPRLLRVSLLRRA
ncbi:hypothetical protein B0H13DRAFT_1866844 [Mycena leptocephala]|nr:hypothetical protein B0H13DRAFT_1866844 [Mycena leptocephala]